MKKQDAIDLLEKYRAGNCTEEEIILLRTWFHQFNAMETADLSATDLNKATADMWQAIERNKEGKVKKTVVLWRYIAAAAAIILILLAATNIFFRSNDTPKPQLATKAADSSTVQPGGEKAYLTLANGTTISLTDAATGEIAKEAGVHISKTASGQLVYTVTEGKVSAGNTPEYNTISTPRGGQYQVQLPDGTKVWLNAASSLRYPAVFTASERKVTLTGEGYFEVSHDKARPFIVQTAAQQVTVLGTQFNINAYPETSNTITTLLTGSIQVANAISTGTATLKPGQQSINDRTIKIINVDPTEAIAWKNGFLLFDNEDFATIMNRIARWYDLEIEYRTTPTGLQLGGRVSLHRKLPDVLAALEATGKVHFQVTGKKVIVTE